MRGQLNLWGEIEENEVVKIAEGGVEKRGYAIYSDYNEYMRQKICEGRLEPVRAGWFLFPIRETLIANGWILDSDYRERRFYPPSYSSSEQTELKMGKEKVS